ncbi:hypothetical protein GCM10023340_04090 [Nocardioides marinquilinus]|uniref:DUF2207 domain-containing protein n=1 Tax=Nocardioides marinquilinus TaxID=1210400 RepID=A0ABP9PA72_9ACTN
MTIVSRDARRSVLAGLVAAAVLVVVLVAFVSLLVVAVVRTVKPPDAAGPGGARMVATPDRQSIRAVIGTGGQVEVTYQVRSTRLVSSLRVSADVTAVRPDLEALDVVVTTGGVSVARLPAVGPDGVEVPLSWPVREFEVSYRLSAPADDGTGSVDGRGLAFVPTLRLAYSGATGPVRREVVARGQDVLNVACLAPDDAVAQPCGSATEAGWTADLATPDADDGLVIQVQQRDP